MNIGDTLSKQIGPNGNKYTVRGTIIGDYPKFWLVDFGKYRECFLKYGRVEE